jgi:hypothetical protein
MPSSPTRCRKGRCRGLRHLAPPHPGRATSVLGPPSSCAACKRQRRRCTAGRVLAPYFQASKPEKFRVALRLFNVENMLRILKAAGPARWDACILTILYEADVQRRDPARGCRDVLQDLELSDQFRHAYVELSTGRELRQSASHARFGFTGKRRSSWRRLVSDDGLDAPRLQQLKTSRQATPEVQSSKPSTDELTMTRQLQT